MRRAVAALALTAALATGGAAATADRWNGPCQPSYPGVDQLVAALPTYACFTAGERTADGYRLDVSYSGQEHDVDDALALAHAEARVFWEQFPYPVSGIRIDTTAAFGESVVKNVNLTGPELRALFGPRPTRSGDLPDPPAGRAEIVLWTLSGLLLATAAGLLLR
ncbi:hypothetical protein ABT095_06420 [Kitasatospora sp. NPDC002227]|uniref:hypothetical protein n=1 Tax=Kitasatospora sp. NPDC002227 TaxID=3154773 RepID=UPI00332919CE